MKNIRFSVGNCPVCGDCGRMEILYDVNIKKCIAVCCECELEFDSIVDYKTNKNGYRDFCDSKSEPSVREATLEEIKKSEWYSYLEDRYWLDLELDNN